MNARGSDHVSAAVTYAALVGRYVRMDRPATEAEIAGGQPETIGMECLVAMVADQPDGVAIVADYGYEFIVRPGEDWTFTIWPDEKARGEWR